MGGRRSHEPTVRNQLARRLKGFNARTRSTRKIRSVGDGTPQGSRHQRVVMKTHVSRHRPGKARGSLARHVSYLGRDTASLDGRPGTFYDAVRGDVAAKQEAAHWAEDRHHFRIIVSPERGADIPDLTAYVREVMARVERDLKTKLQWVGINHHNTDNPHAHVVIRGRREDGKDLVIPRKYIARGMRDRAAEVATELLGERSANDRDRALENEIRAERFTSLDRMIERNLEGGRVEVSASRQIGFDAGDRCLVIARLQALEEMGLARKDRGTWWRLAPAFGQTLRDLGARNDMIRQLYPSLGAEAGRVHRMGTSREPETPVAGVVIAKGGADELTDARFVVLRDAAGRAHYGRVPDGDAYRDLCIGSIAELGITTARRRALADEILAIVAANSGTYSTAAHATLLRGKASPGGDPEPATVLQLAVRRLASWSGRDDTGVRPIPATADQFQIDAVTFEQFLCRAHSARTDLHVLAARPLAEQVEARASTWLDRQLARGQLDARVADHSAVREAVVRRADWLVRNGYARVAPEQPYGVELATGALERLSTEERAVADARLKRRYGQPVATLPEGTSVTGAYGGTEPLHAGKSAVVMTDETVYVFPVSREPDLATGAWVCVKRGAGREADLEPVTGRRRSRDAQRADGLEAGQ